MHMRYIVISGLQTAYILHYIVKGTILEKKNITANCVLISYKFFV
jgi:hypothetical protein